MSADSVSAIKSAGVYSIDGTALPVVEEGGTAPDVARVLDEARAAGLESVVVLGVRSEDNAFFDASSEIRVDEKLWLMEVSKHLMMEDATRP